MLDVYILMYNGQVIGIYDDYKKAEVIYQSYMTIRGILPELLWVDMRKVQ